MQERMMGSTGAPVLRYLFSAPQKITGYACSGLSIHCWPWALGRPMHYHEYTLICVCVCVCVTCAFEYASTQRLMAGIRF